MIYSGSDGRVNNPPVKLSKITMMKKYPICTCDICKSMCTRPCIPTPREAINLINAGFGDRLSYDDRYNNDGDYWILKPAKKREEGYKVFERVNYIAEYYKTTCTFQNDETGLCDLHDLGLKPIEARLAYHEKRGDSFDLHDKVIAYWNNPSAKKIVDNWMKKYCKE